MTIISLDSEIVRDLVNTKLQVLDSKIQKILSRWGLESVDQLIERAKSGELEEAESDAIEIQNLTAKREEIENIVHD